MWHWASQEHRLREAPGSSPGSAVRTHPQPAQQPQAERSSLIVCAACHAAVTSPRERIECSGAHAHTFLNPAGVVYRIRCFAAAPGVLPAGESSDYWTWFPGFHWQACLCKACFEHLGWSFHNADRRFFGLIADRVLELEEPRGPLDRS